MTIPSTSNVTGTIDNSRLSVQAVNSQATTQTTAVAQTDSVVVNRMDLNTRNGIKAALDSVFSELEKIDQSRFTDGKDFTADELAGIGPNTTKFFQEVRRLVNSVTVGSIAETFEAIGQELKSKNNKYYEIVVLGGVQEIARLNTRTGEDQAGIKYLGNLLSINSLLKWDALPAGLSKGTAEAATTGLSISSTYGGGSFVYDAVNVASLSSLATKGATAAIANSSKIGTLLGKLEGFGRWMLGGSVATRSTGAITQEGLNPVNIFEDDLRTAYERRFVNRNNLTSVVGNGLGAIGTGLGIAAAGAFAFASAPAWILAAAGVAAGAYAFGWAGQSRGGNNILETLPGFGGSQNLSADELVALSDDISNQLKAVALETGNAAVQFVKNANTQATSVMVASNGQTPSNPNQSPPSPPTNNEGRTVRLWP